jgi:tripeptidyl-peptidase-1
MKFSLTIALGLASAATAAPTALGPYTVHEKRETNLEGWAISSKASRSAKVPVSIGLTQRNLDKGHDFLMDVSEPGSANYGKHWTPEEVRTDPDLTLIHVQ